MTIAAPPIELFFSYSHCDEALRDELEKHLSILRRQGVIANWHDRCISAGAEWKDAIDAHLESARVILLLISSDFLASDYCYDIELKRALERHESHAALVIPIILRPCDWQTAQFSKLQGLPTNAKPVTLWPNRDEAWTDVVRGIRRAVEQLRNKPAGGNQLGAPSSNPPAGQGNVTIGGNLSGSVIITGTGNTVISNPARADKQPEEPVAAAPELSFRRKQQFVEALLACDCLNTPQALNQVIAGLPAAIGNRINRHPNPMQDVTSVVNTCLRFPAGIARLLEIVSAYEGDSLPWQRVQAVAREIFPELSAE